MLSAYGENRSITDMKPTRADMVSRCIRRRRWSFPCRAMPVENLWGNKSSIRSCRRLWRGASPVIGRHELAPCRGCTLPGGLRSGPWRPTFDRPRRKPRPQFSAADTQGPSVGLKYNKLNRNIVNIVNMYISVSYTHLTLPTILRV